MIVDNALLLDEETSAVTADQATANYIDTDITAPDQGTYAKRVEMIFTITTTGTGTGTYEFKAETDDNSSFSSAKTLATSGAIVGTSCTKNKQIRLVLPASGWERYIRGYVDVTGTVGAMTYDCVINHLV